MVPLQLILEYSFMFLKGIIPEKKFCKKTKHFVQAKKKPVFLGASLLYKYNISFKVQKTQSALLLIVGQNILDQIFFIFLWSKHAMDYE